MPSIMIIITILAIVCGGCQSGPQNSSSFKIIDPDLVIGKTWQWTSTHTSDEKTIIEHPERYTIFFDHNKTAKARFDCNRGGADFEISRGKLSFGPFISTRMACPEDSRDAEFINLLQQVHAFFFQDDRLCLVLSDGKTTMMFTTVQKL